MHNAKSVLSFRISLKFITVIAVLFFGFYAWILTTWKHTNKLKYKFTQKLHASRQLTPTANCSSETPFSLKDSNTLTNFNLNIPQRFIVDIEKANDHNLQGSVPDLAKTEFDFVQRPDKKFCNYDVEILVLVKSSLEHNELRNIIRQTWGSIRNVSGVQVRTAFLIGMTSNSTLLRDVTNETRTFGDVILGSYYDTYKNLTVKALMGLKWNHLYCRSSFFLLADDDAFINLRKIAQDYAIARSPKSNEIQCGHILARHAKVLRRGKWAVSPEIYDLPYYPPYCWGPCFIMSKDVAEKIYLTSCHTHSDFAIDDVFVSGVLREKIGVSLGRMPKGSCLYLDNKNSDIKEKFLSEWKKIL